MKVVASGSVSLQQPTSSAPASGPVAEAPRSERPKRPRPRESSVREYHNEALDRSDRMAAPPSPSQSASQSESQSQQQQAAQQAAEAAKTMRDVLAENMKSFMEQWKIQHEASTAAGSTCLGQMKACSDSLGKAMQAWAQMMYGGSG